MHMVSISHIHALGDELVRARVCMRVYVWKRPQLYYVTLRPSIARAVRYRLGATHFYK